MAARHREYGRLSQLIRAMTQNWKLSRQLKMERRKSYNDFPRPSIWNVDTHG